MSRYLSTLDKTSLISFHRETSSMSRLSSPHHADAEQTSSMVSSSNVATLTVHNNCRLCSVEKFKWVSVIGHPKNSFGNITDPKKVAKWKVERVTLRALAGLPIFLKKLFPEIWNLNTKNYRDVKSSGLQLNLSLRSFWVLLIWRPPYANGGCNFHLLN